MNRNNIQPAVTNMTKPYVVIKTLIKDLTFRIPQHTSSEVTVGYNTRFEYFLFDPSSKLLPSRLRCWKR